MYVASAITLSSIYTESELTYKLAFDITQAMQAAAKDTQDLKKPAPSCQRVQHVQDRRSACHCCRCSGNHLPTRLTPVVIFVMLTVKRVARGGHIAESIIKQECSPYLKSQSLRMSNNIYTLVPHEREKQAHSCFCQDTQGEFSLGN